MMMHVVLYNLEKKKLGNVWRRRVEEDAHKV
jgi:hypothetical protein